MPLSLENVSYSYISPGTNDIKALDKINLTVNEGDFIGIMGHTGSGKTTLIHILSGLIEPQNGTVYYDGNDINSKTFDKTILRESIGIVFQFPEHMLFEISVEKELTFGLKHSGLAPNVIKNRIEQALIKTGLPPDKFLHQNPFTLSGGEKRRIAISSVLVKNPKYLILDEPFSGMDPKGCQLIIQTLRNLNTEGITIIVISHNIDALCECARRILVMNKGTLIMDGTSNEILSQTEKLKTLKLDSPDIIKIRDAFDFPVKINNDDPMSYNSLLCAIKTRLKAGVS